MKWAGKRLLYAAVAAAAVAAVIAAILWFGHGQAPASVEGLLASPTPAPPIGG